MGTVLTSGNFYNSSDVASRTAPATFRDTNGNWYHFEISETVSAIHTHIKCVKSSNDGSTWAEYDSSNRPAHTNGYDNYGIDFKQDGSTIHIIATGHPYASGMDNAADYHYYTFEMSDTTGTEGWAISEEAWYTVTLPGSIAYSCWFDIRDDGDIVVSGVGELEPVMGNNYYRAWWWERTGTNTWSSGTNLIGAGASTSYRPVGASRDESDNIHFFLTGNSPKNVRVSPTGTIDNTNGGVLSNAFDSRPTGGGIKYYDGSEWQVLWNDGAAGLNTDQSVYRSAHSSGHYQNDTTWNIDPGGGWSDTNQLGVDLDDYSVFHVYTTYDGSDYRLKTLWHIDPSSATWSNSQELVSAQTEYLNAYSVGANTLNGSGDLMVIYYNNATSNLESVTYNYKIAPQDVTHSADVILAGTVEHSADLYGRYTFRAHSADLIKFGQGTEAHSANFLTVFRETETHNTDVYPARLETHGADLIGRYTFRPHDADLQVVDRQTDTHSADILLNDVISPEHSSDILIEQNLFFDLEELNDPQVHTGHTIKFRFKVWDNDGT